MNLKKKEMTRAIVGRKYCRINENYSQAFRIGDIATLIESDDDDDYALFRLPDGEMLSLDLDFMQLIDEDGILINALKARVAELEAQLANQPKPDWWQRYKVGDKIDLIGLEIVEIDGTDTHSPIRVKDGTTQGGADLYFDDRHIRPHKPE